MALKQYYKTADPSFWDARWSGNSFETAVTYVRSYKQYKLMRRYTDRDLPALEGGCGLSQWVYAMHHDGYDVTGVDYAGNTVRMVNQLAPELDIREGDVFHLDFPDKHFGTYYSWGVVEHFENGPDSALREAYRVINTGGYLLISVPYLNPARRKAYAGLAAIGSGNEFYQYLFEENEFREKLVSAGFQVESVVKLNWMQTFKELMAYRRRLSGGQSSWQVETKRPGSHPGKRSRNFLAVRVMKKVLIKLADCSLLTNRYGHMLMFVAKKN